MPDNIKAMELEALREENARLREELEALAAELDELRFESDLDACHAAGLSAQLRALIAEGDSCPDKDHHKLLERAGYVNDRTGEPMTKTKAYPFYREAFDAEARERGIDEPERHRA